MPSFGVLKRVQARLHWPHEALSFTPWLADHLDQLGESLGIDLELRSREAPVGGYSLDLLAHDVGQDRRVIIENQLEATDHDHLGKLLTYAAGFDAEVVVWLCSEFREEHRQALDWLNIHTDEKTEFFGVVLEVLQIDDSKPAVNFKPVVVPNGWQKSNRPIAQAAEVSERGEEYRKFFQELIDELRTKHAFTNARIAQPQNWHSFSTKTSGIVYSAAFARQGPSVQLYIDHGTAQVNKAIFDHLLNDRVAIEEDLGPLSWERLDAKRACRIAIYREGGLPKTGEESSDIRNWMITFLHRFRNIFTTRVAAAAAIASQTP